MGWPSRRSSTRPTSNSTRRCLETEGCGKFRVETISLTARYWETRKLRMSRRRGSATALKASEVVEARGMIGSYSHTGICQALFFAPPHWHSGLKPRITLRQNWAGAVKIDGYVEPDCGI